VCAFAYGSADERKEVKKKVRARGSARTDAREFKAPKGGFPESGKGEDRELRERQWKLNEGRTHEFSLDASKRLSGRNRIAVFGSNLPDPERFEYKTSRRLYEAVAALRRGTVDAELRTWLVGTLQRLADQVNQAKPDWDARAAFELAKSPSARAADTTWVQPFLALDVEFERAAGQTTEGAIEATGKAWSQAHHAVGKAHAKWSKACRKIVSTVKREDGRDGISAADSAADHLTGLRIYGAQRARVEPGQRPGKRRG
jgi:hypothetical protein